MTHLTGLLLVDKPVGPTSHDVVGRVRKVAGTRKVGHAGTLDPFASGLLMILLGSATRLSEYFLGLDKEYEATLLLGTETTTHDPEGDVVAESGDWRNLSAARLEEALGPFRGRILQKPPAYSAKKVQGESAHRRVRRGENVDLDPVEVEIRRLEVAEVDLPRVCLKVQCSSGTYIRALARDLGRALEVGGHLSALRRTRIGAFSLSSATTFEAVGDLDAVQDSLIPPARALAHLPSIEVGEEAAERIEKGQSLPGSGADVPESIPVRVLLHGELLAIASRDGDRLRPRKVFAHG